MAIGTGRMPPPNGHLHQHIKAPTLLSHSLCWESWWTDQPVSRKRVMGIEVQCTDDLLFAVIETPETATSATLVISPLEFAAEIAYRQLFKVLDILGYPYLWRVWNYIPDINITTHQQERYRQFNSGRQKGFANSNRAVTGNVPAACAIGVANGHLSIGFLASKTPSVPIENPRQISAYCYPIEYGTHSPTFSRASLAQLGNQELLFLSGTASIVGHQTLHEHDVEKQTLETLENIEILLKQANTLTQRRVPYRLEDLLLRAYIRRSDDAYKVSQALRNRLGLNSTITYVLADICRSDLLVEIEGVAWQTTQPA